MLMQQNIAKLKYIVMTNARTIIKLKLILKVFAMKRLIV